MRRAGVVWLALVLATAATAVVGGGTVGARLGVALVVVLAFAKVVAVGLEFMELRHAGRAERWAFLAWVAVVGVTCTVLAVA